MARAWDNVRDGRRPGQRVLSREKVLAAVWAVWHREGRPPSLQELSHEFGINSRSACLWYIEQLITDGELEEELDAKGNRKTLWPSGLRAVIREAVEFAQVRFGGSCHAGSVAGRRFRRLKPERPKPLTGPRPVSTSSPRG